MLAERVAKLSRVRILEAIRVAPGFSPASSFRIAGFPPDNAFC